MKARLKSADTRCMLWVALCFTLTSGVYLSWLDRAVNVAGANAADWVPDLSTDAKQFSSRSPD